MALPYARDEGPEPLPADEKKKAILNLLLVVAAIDFIVIATYFYLVLGLGWDPTIALIPLLAVSMATGLYFAWQKGKIETGR
jgi:CHASE2 domain-containing sensor protein